jgi:phosphoribosyl-ATP pyrophosphohydrolase/phosphoribosyl-AMP cyclohydrolase
LDQHAIQCADTCWQTENKADYGFISHLANYRNPKRKADSEKSYVASLFQLELIK